MKQSFIFLLLIVIKVNAQTFRGTFPGAKNTEIVLTSFDGFETQELSKTTTDSLGNFIINYPKSYIGAALLQINNTSNLILLLNNENFEIYWSDLQDFSSLKFINSTENDVFAKGIITNQDSEQKLAGLKYLLPQYANNPKEKEWLIHEIANQEKHFTNFLDSLPDNSYAKLYLKIRKLISDMPLTANRYIERMNQHEKDFANLNFASNNLWHSGLLKELFEGYYQLMESHIEPDLVYSHCNTATDAWIKSIANNPIRQQEIAEFTFKLLEKRSIFKAAEYVALQMLNQTNCQIDEKRTNLFEQYRKMAIGNTASNIVFYSNDTNRKKVNLKKLKNNYKLVVFGASWCPNCQTDYLALKEKYSEFKQNHDLEIVYISIDTDKTIFDNYYKEAPFITFCDAKGWETQAAKEYYVFATPTYILLNKDLKILVKLNSPEHLEAWLKN